MKLFKYYLICIFCFLFLSLDVFAAPSSILTVNKSSIENGSSVTGTVTIYNVASWQVTISCNGATSGNSNTESDVTSSGDNTTKTVSVTCKSTNTGIINFTIKGNATSSDGSKVQLTGNKQVTVTVPRAKSTNNKLKSLLVEGYEISPKFANDVKEYSVTVPSTVEKIVINASKADSYASLDGIGEKDVEEGINQFEIVVTSETGVSNVYKLNVNVEDQNPIEVEVDGKKYTVVKLAKNLVKPELFNETTIKINDLDIPAFTNEVCNYTLVGLKDTDGNISLFVYNKGKYTKYNEFTSNSVNIVFLDFSKVIKYYKKSIVKINDENVNCYKNGDSIIVYGTNLVNGKKNYYTYNKQEKTLQIFVLEAYEKEINDMKKQRYIFYGICLLCILLFIMLLLINGKNRKLKKYIKKNIIKEYEYEIKSNKVNDELIEKNNENEYEQDDLEIKGKKKKIKKSKK